MKILVNESALVRAKALANAIDTALLNDARNGRETALTLSEMLLETLEALEGDEGEQNG
jgi:hypothetical protein